MSRLDCSKQGYTKHIILIVFVIALSFVFLPRPIHANAAAPPALVVLVNNAPDDLEVEFKGRTFTHPGGKRSVAWETYFVFYPNDIMQAKHGTLLISSGGKSFELSFDLAQSGYDRVYTLNLAKQSLVPGTAPFRFALLVTIRVLLTLLIEGAIFFAFGFRSKRSWRVFLVTNLITQASLNIIIATSLTPVSTAFYGIWLLEFLILLVEFSVFMIVINEHGLLRRGAYALVANIASFMLGSYLIQNLPV